MKSALTNFKPNGAGTRSAALAGAVKHAKAAKKWQELWSAVDALIAEQEQVVAWWKVNVSANHGGDRKSSSAIRLLDFEEAEKRLGLTQRQVSRWRSRLKRCDEYRKALYGAAYKKAMAGAVHVEHNSGENEWYTPPDIIERARRTMGGIDCDPASNEIANTIVQAGTYFTAQHNGLAQRWFGRVWMNPPYVQPLCAEFCDALRRKFANKEIDQACVLVNNATETGWLQPMLKACSALCFPLGRVRFLDRTGKPANSPLQGQSILYFGENRDVFGGEFGPLGVILGRHE